MTLKRKTVVLLSKDDITEAWGSLKRACEAHPEIVYNTITKFALPCEFKGWYIERVDFNPESDEDGVCDKFDRAGLLSGDFGGGGGLIGGIGAGVQRFFDGSFVNFSHGFSSS